GGTYVAKQYKLLSATGGVTGTFASISNSGLPFGASDTLSYDANDVYLNLTLGFTTFTGLNVNQRNVANTLTNFVNSTGGIQAQFAGLTPANLSQIDGEAATGAETSAFQLTDQFLALLVDHSIGSRGEVSAGEASGRGPALAFTPLSQAAAVSDAA